MPSSIRKLFTAVACVGLLSDVVIAHGNTHHHFDEHDEYLFHSHHEDIAQYHRHMTNFERCSTTTPTLEELRQDRAQVEVWRESNGCTTEAETCPPLEQDVTISVYWHGIQRSNGSGGITDEMITSSITVLNEAYAGTGFSFRLEGNTTTSNDRYYSAVFGTSVRDMKSGLRQGDAKTLNVYSTGIDQTSGLLGYAQFPFMYAMDPILDGVVIGAQTAPGGSSFPYDEGDTLVHEVGHWLGLYHVFQGGCGLCGFLLGDEVSDTPPQEEPTRGCPTGQDSCPFGGVDSVHNFMDYSTDDCMYEFTPGQITRMQEQWNTYRANGEDLIETETSCSLIDSALKALSQVSSFLFNGS